MLTLNLYPITKLTSEQFQQLAAANRDLRLERDKEGNLIIMPPAGWGTGERNSKLTFQLSTWLKKIDVLFMDNTWDGKPLCVGAQRLKAPSLWFANFLCLPT